MIRQNSLQIAVKRAVTSTVDCALSTPYYSLYEAVNQNFQFVFGMIGVANGKCETARRSFFLCERETFSIFKMRDRAF